MPPGLLPKQTDDFHSKQYWQTFFERRGDESFEWYGSYAELRAIVEHYAMAGNKDRFVADFVAAWHKVMMNDRYE